jgi:flagellar FliJ protein
MNPDTTALRAVLQHAEGERDHALAQLTQLADAQTRLRSQQEQLQTYRRDYHARWTAQFRLAGTVEVMLHYQGFVERLNQALEQLDMQLEMAARQTEQAREVLMERETRVLALRKLIERRGLEQARRVAQREQRHSDELAARISLQRPPTLASAGNA